MKYLFVLLGNFTLYFTPLETNATSRRTERSEEHKGQKASKT
jgi:hypothetical protein